MRSDGRSAYGKAVTRYLTSHTGIPDLRWKYEGSLIEAPAPYSLDVTGDKSTARLLAKVRERGEEGLGAVISRIGAVQVADSYVAMNLRAYAVLLGTHYEAVTLPRIQQGKE